MNITQIDLTLIVPGNNDRTVFKQSELEALADTIKDNGLIQPISVRQLLKRQECEAAAMALKSTLAFI